MAKTGDCYIDMAERSIGEFLSDEGYVSNEEGDAIDNPEGSTAAAIERDRHDAVVNDVSDMFDGAANVSGMSSEGDGADLDAMQRDRAVSVARLSAAEIDDADEAESKAKDLHSKLGPELSEDQQAAVDAFRNRAAELQGHDLSLIGEHGVPEQYDPRIRTDPRPTQFEAKKEGAKRTAANKARQLERQNESGDYSYDDAARADMYRRREAAIEEAENLEELKEAKSIMQGDPQ